MKAAVTGTGHFLPARLLTNDELCRMVDTSDEWIRTRTGIEIRHVAVEESLADMAENAARLALANAGRAENDVDMILVCCATPDLLFPTIACRVQHRLGAERAFCFDINAGCTGFVYAQDCAARYLHTGGAACALVIAVDHLTRIVDYTDRGTCVLFGDGAGAVVMEHCDDNAFLASFLGSEGKNHAILRAGIPVQPNPFGRADEAVSPYIYMDGAEVFRFVSRVMPQAMDQVLRSAGMTMNEVTYIIPHQANARITDSVVHRYHLPKEKVISTIAHTGNTSASSVPIALDTLYQAGKLCKGDVILCVGFGAGLTYGATLFRWEGKA